MKPGRRRWLLLALSAGLCATLVSCGGGSDPLSEPGDVPVPIKAQPTEVDVCALIPAESAAGILDTPLKVVGVAYGAAKLPTYSCDLGTEFGVAELTVQLTTGPISANVFDAAYGDVTGGDPTYLPKLGDGSWLRTEEDQRSLHMFASGAIVSLHIQVDPAAPVKRPQVVELAQLALTRLPEYPRLKPTAAGEPCSSVAKTALSAAIGAEPASAGHLTGPQGSMICTWGSDPGSAHVTVITTPDRVRAYQRTLDQNLYAPVPDLDLGPGLTVLSRNDRAGDLLVFKGSSAMITISVVPTAGFSDDSISTTPGEIALASQVIAHLL